MHASLQLAYTNKVSDKHHRRLIERAQGVGLQSDEMKDSIQ